MIAALIVDDQPLVRAGLRALFEHAPDIHVVGEAGDGLAALEQAQATRPDVVLMDIRMPRMDGIEAIRRLAADPGTRDVAVLVLTTFDLDEYLYAAIQAGARGFLLKDAPPERVFDAVRIVAAGDALIDPAATRRLVETTIRRRGAVPAAEARRLDGLTEREREVLGLVGQGLSNTEIASRLLVSEATAKTHVSRLLAKLQVRDRPQLVVTAYETGVVRPGDTASHPAG
ncbi:response regulator [Geodermatophilus sp. CPCC 205761]|uniref:response regulator n=1 Tax=Geodermatophilus sp. CPCC 205761 TaxID=2936597 RepID=UPI003EEB8B4F